MKKGRSGKLHVQAACTAAALSLALTLAGMSARAQTRMMSDGASFDPEYYAEKNPDVAAAFGTDPAALYRHYTEWGQAEHRAPFAPMAQIPGSSEKDPAEKDPASGLYYREYFRQLDGTTTVHCYLVENPTDRTIDVKAGSVFYDRKGSRVGSDGAGLITLAPHSSGMAVSSLNPVYLNLADRHTVSLQVTSPSWRYTDYREYLSCRGTEQEDGTFFIEAENRGEKTVSVANVRVLFFRDQKPCGYGSAQMTVDPDYFWQLRRSTCAPGDTYEASVKCGTDYDFAVWYIDCALSVNQ